jgi:sugar phosphate isomerase/epimerase
VTKERPFNLGLNVARGHWPTPATLKAHEAAGFTAVQVHTPPREMLADRERCLSHAGALRGALDTTSLRLVLHAPDELSAGTYEHDRAFEGLLEYAAASGAEIVAYHGLNFRGSARGASRAGTAGGGRLRDRVLAEERSLRRFAGRAAELGVTIAVENLAPVYPGPPRLCHDPLRVRDLVRTIGAPSVGMLLDVGHAHITCALQGLDLAEVVDAVAEDVALFHLHDNLGARRAGFGHPGVDPLRLDLHLAPGAGTLPWAAIGRLLRLHGALLMLEVEPSHRPALTALAQVTGTLLSQGAGRMPLAA